MFHYTVYWDVTKVNADIDHAAHDSDTPHDPFFSTGIWHILKPRGLLKMAETPRHND